MSEWVMTSKAMPPQDTRILAYGPEIGIMTGEYHYYPAWKPFDEEHWGALRESHPEIYESQKNLNRLMRGEKEKHLFVCACEDSNWNIDVVHCWMPLPEEPAGGTYRTISQED